MIAVSPIDATEGWDDEFNANRYAEFASTFPMYTRTSEELLESIRLTGTETVVDLCGGTGTTSQVVLDRLGEAGRVVSIDASAAMQAAGRARIEDHRLTWITGGAESVNAQLDDCVAAIVCNSAIWKCELDAVLPAAYEALCPSGSVAFNIGAGFLGMEKQKRTPDTGRPRLSALIREIAQAEYGLTPEPAQAKQSLTTEQVLDALTRCGFRPLPPRRYVYRSSLEEKKAWLSIPVFSRPAGPLSYEQRMLVLEAAFERADPDEVDVTEWVYFSAMK